MAEEADPKKVTGCYIFKCRLQEYAQKLGYPTPVYQTVKEGPSHEAVFRSTVFVNNVGYDSLPGFFNRKSAEQSAAEIALIELQKSGQATEYMPTVHETGLCKNLLQEYAQKMNYACPVYLCNKQPSEKTPYSCIVVVGGIQYMGAAARTKKEAEIKAARTALLAIQSNSRNSETNCMSQYMSQYTVLPGKRKGKESETQTDTVKSIKPKRTDFKKKWSKKKFPKSKGGRSRFSKIKRASANGDSSGIQEVANGEMPEVNKQSESGQPRAMNLSSGGHGMGNMQMEEAIVHEESPRDPTIETNGCFYHVEVPPVIMEA